MFAQTRWKLIFRYLYALKACCVIRYAMIRVNERFDVQGPSLGVSHVDRIANNAVQEASKQGTGLLEEMAIIVLFFLIQILLLFSRVNNFFFLIFSHTQ